METSLLGNLQSSGEAIYRLGEDARFSANDIIIVSCLVELLCNCQTVHSVYPLSRQAHSQLRGNYAPETIFS